MRGVLLQFIQLGLLIFLNGTVVAENNKPVKMLSIDGIPAALLKNNFSRDNIPSPHWKDSSCIVCHTTQISPTKKNIRKTNVSEICLSCHDAEYGHHYIHPIDVTPSAAMLKRMQGSYKKSMKRTSGKISCATCHDIAIQCEASNSAQKLTNPKFFRLGPFKDRSEPCYFCHEQKQYKRLNPHKQLDDKGAVKAQTCRICHAGSIEKLKLAASIEEVEFHAPKDNLVSMCWGCHVWTPHPGGQFSFFKNKSGPNHLIKPTAAIMTSLRFMEKSKKIIFPIEPETGKIFCATCHNPHQQGVVKNKAAAKGADSKWRLRDQHICENCHSK